MAETGKKEAEDMLGFSRSAFEGLPWWVGVASLGWAIAFVSLAVRDLAEFDRKTEDSYERGLGQWLQECRGDGRRIDDCTSAWQRDAVLRRLYVEAGAKRKEE